MTDGKEEVNLEISYDIKLFQLDYIYYMTDHVTNYMIDY